MPSVRHPSCPRPTRAAAGQARGSGAALRSRRSGGGTLQGRRERGAGGNAGAGTRPALDQPAAARASGDRRVQPGRTVVDSPLGTTALPSASIATLGKRDVRPPHATEHDAERDSRAAARRQPITRRPMLSLRCSRSSTRGSNDATHECTCDTPPETAHPAWPGSTDLKRPHGIPWHGDRTPAARNAQKFCVALEQTTGDLIRRWPCEREAHECSDGERRRVRQNQLCAPPLEIGRAHPGAHPDHPGVGRAPDLLVQRRERHPVQ